jgi:hypothetical protein
MLFFVRVFPMKGNASQSKGGKVNLSSLAQGLFTRVNIESHPTKES